VSQSASCRRIPGRMAAIFRQADVVLRPAAARPWTVAHSSRPCEVPAGWAQAAQSFGTDQGRVIARYVTQLIERP
jgi:hypothetical protein